MIPRLNSNNLDLNRVTDPNTPQRHKEKLVEEDRGYYQSEFAYQNQPIITNEE